MATHLNLAPPRRGWPIISSRAIGSDAIGVLARRSSFARHSRESGNPASLVCLYFIRAKASTRLWRAGHFFFNSEEKVTKKTPPRMPRSHEEAVRVREVTPGFARHTSVYVRELTRILRVILRTDPSRPRRGKRGPRSKAKSKAKVKDRRSPERGGFWEPMAPFAVPSIAGCGGKSPQARAHEARASDASTRMC